MVHPVIYCGNSLVQADKDYFSDLTIAVYRLCRSHNLVGKHALLGDNDLTENFFNLQDLSQGIARDLADGVSTRIFPGDQAMLSVVQLEPGRESDVHSHPQEQWGVILSGSGMRIQDGDEHPVTVGDFWRTPGGIPHAFRAGPDGAKVLDIFSPPREEYRMAGAGVFAPDSE